MARKSKKDTPSNGLDLGVTVEAEVSESPKAFQPNPEAENVKTAKPRFSVTLKEDGSLDLASMREDTRNRLKEILRDPRTRDLLGGVDVPEIVSDDDVKMLYDLVAMIEAYAFTFAGKIDFDIAQRHATFTEQQKMLLLPSTKNVIIKNADKMAFAIRWKDEVILCALLLTITRAKYEGARKDQAAREEQKRAENPATAESAVM